MHLLENPTEVKQLREVFREVHQELRGNANQAAAAAVLETMGLAETDD